MATEPTSSGTGATPGSGSPETGTTSNGATPAKPATTLEEALAKIAELERHASNKTEEAARHGKNLSAAEKELAAYKEKERQVLEANLSEVEKEKKARAQAEAQIAQYKQQLIIARVERAAQQKGIIDPELAALAITDKLEYGDDGMPTNLEKVLDDLIKNKPYLVTAPETPPASPAQRVPALPPNNPGRSTIPTPTSRNLKDYKLSDYLK